MNISVSVRRVSVVRGKVLTPSGQGLRGVRVSNGLSLKEGFTLTRSDGWFDMLVNGGGVVTLKFGKSPFPYQSRSVYVPWNQVKIDYTFIYKLYLIIIIILDGGYG